MSSTDPARSMGGRHSAHVFGPAVEVCLLAMPYPGGPPRMTGPWCVDTTSSSVTPPPRDLIVSRRDVGLPPLALPLVLAGVVEPLDVEVVVIGLGVGHAPCHAGVVAEMGKAGAAREGEPQGVEVGAGDVVLVVDVGGVERPVGVARNERLPRGRAAAQQGPVVAPPLGVREPAHVRCAGRKLRQSVPVAAGVRGAWEA